MEALYPKILFPPVMFIKKILPGTCTGISFIDSTSLRVCHNQRILIHKILKGFPTRAMFRGMVFRIQSAPDNQPPRGDSQFHVHAWKRGCPEPVETR